MRIRHRQFGFKLTEAQVRVLRKIAWAREAFNYSPSIRATRIADGLRKIGLIRPYDLRHLGWQLTDLAYEYLEAYYRFYRPPRDHSQPVWWTDR